MARKKKRRRSRKFKGINLVDAGLGYAGLSVWTNAAFNLDPWAFFTSREPGTSTMAHQVTLKELLTKFGKPHGGTSPWAAKSEGQIVQANIEANWMDGLWKSAGILVIGAVGKRLTKKPRAWANKTIRNVGLGDMVRL